jgi:uncharacterized SAM-binding protein YcdF (DUF218 family)
MTYYFIITKQFLQPLPLLLLLLGMAIANLWRKRRESRRRLLLLTVPFVILVLTTIPAVIFPLVGTLEWRYPPLASRPEDADAIVVLSGGMIEPDAVRRRAELAEDTLSRCLRGAEIYHEGKPCPVIVTGDVLDSGSDIPAVASVMRDMLIRLGVADPDVLVEAKARTTFENAVETRKIVEAKGLRKVILVTEAIHMPRSLRCFRKQGIDAVPAPCRHRATVFHGRINFFMPSPGAIGDLMAVLHEWLGLVWYRLSGKI